MAYSCSSYFSDQNSYITLFISSYILEDINFTSFAKRKEICRGWTELDLRCHGPELGLHERQDVPGRAKLRAGEKIWPAAHQAPDLNQGTRDLCEVNMQNYHGTT